MLREVLFLTQGDPFCQHQKNGEAPIYEYQYVCIFHHIIVGEPSFHRTDEEAKALYTEHGKWHKIVETKRERKADR